MPELNHPRPRGWFSSRTAKIGAAGFALFAILAIVGWYGWKIPAQPLAERVVRTALGPEIQAGRIQLLSPSQLRIDAVEVDGFSVDRVHVHLSPFALLQGEGVGAVTRIDLAGVDLLWSEFVGAFPSGGDAAAAPAIPALPGWTVVVSDGRFRMTETDAVESFQAALTFAPDGISAKVSGDVWRLDASGRAMDAEYKVDLAWRSPMGEADVVARFPDHDWGRPYVEGYVRHVKTAMGEVDQAIALVACPEVMACDITLTAKDGRLWHQHFTALAAEAVLSEGQVTLIDSELRSPNGGSLSAAGLLFGGESGAIDVALEARALTPAEALVWATDDRRILESTGGRLGGELRLTGTFDRLRGEGDYRLERSHFGDALIAGGAGTFHFQDGGFRLDASLRVGDGVLLAEGVRVGSAGLAGDIRADRVAVPALVGVLRGFGLRLEGDERLTGRLSGRVGLGQDDVGGARLTIDVSTERLAYRNITLAPLAASGTWSPAGPWALHRLTLLGTGESPLVEGSGAGDSWQAYDVGLRWRSFPFAWLQELTGIEALTRFIGDGSGEMSLAARDGELYASGDFSVVGSVQGAPVEGEIAFSVRPGGDAEGRGVLRSGAGRLHLDGRWGDEARALDAQLQDFPAGILSGLAGLAPLGGALSGDVRLDLASAEWNIDSNLASPGLSFYDFDLTGAEVRAHLRPSPEGSGERCTRCLFGEVEIQADVSAGDGARRTAEPLHVRLHFDGPQAVLEPTRINLWGGSVRAEGTATLTPQEEWLLQFSSRGDSLRYDQGGVALDLEYALTLSGTWDEPTLGGRVTSHRGDIDLLRLPPLVGSGGGSSGLARLGLDVTADVRNVSVSARSLLDAEVEGSVRAVGSVGRPELYGSLAARRGGFRYYRTYFTLDRGAATFSGANLLPHLDVVGTARVGGRPVHVEVRGPANDLALHVSAEGVASEPEVLRMLGVRTGETGDEEGWQDLARALVTWLDGEVMADVYWRLGRFLERALDVDALRLEPGTSARNVQLRLGKYLTRDVYVSYQRALLGPGEQNVGVEYRLSPYVQVTSDWRGGGSSEVGVKIQLPF